MNNSYPKFVFKVVPKNLIRHYLASLFYVAFQHILDDREYISSGCQCENELYNFQENLVK